MATNLSRLYFTQDVEGVRQIVKGLAHPYIELDNKREDLELLKNLDKNTIIFIKNINKSPITDVLLKLLEDKELYIIATSGTYDVKPTILSRMAVYYRPANYTEAVHRFICYQKIDKENFNIDFLICLCDYLIEHHNKNTQFNLWLIASIIDEIMLATNNLLYDSLIAVLERGFKC